MQVNHYFPSMKDNPQWIGVAFKIGSFYNPQDVIIMGSTVGRYVHCELILGKGMTSDVYAAYDGDVPGSGFTRSCEVYDPKDWVVYSLPANDLTRAKVMSLQLIDAKISYNRKDLWQCCIKAALPFESDLDCDLVDTWKPHGIFCSQMCLLFLRHMARVGDINVNETLKFHLENVHSRGCSPNMLFEIIRNHFVLLV